MNTVVVHYSATYVNSISMSTSRTMVLTAGQNQFSGLSLLDTLTTSPTCSTHFRVGVSILDAEDWMGALWGILRKGAFPGFIRAPHPLWGWSRPPRDAFQERTFLSLFCTPAVTSVSGSWGGKSLSCCACCFAPHVLWFCSGDGRSKEDQVYTAGPATTAPVRR